METGTASLLVSIVALAVSGVSLRVSFSTLRERRHADAAKLRVDFVRSLNEALGRLVSCQTNIEQLRREARLAPESKEKYGVIEDIPSAAAACKESAAATEQLRDFYLSLKSVDLESPKNLRDLQEKQAGLDNQLNEILTVERQILLMLKGLRKANEAYKSASSSK